MTSYADLAREARTVILGLLDTIEMKGVTQARVDTLLRGVETETRCRRPGCDDYVKRAARSYIAGLLEQGEYETIRARYQRPVKVEPAHLPEPERHGGVVPIDLDALNPPPVAPAPIRPAPARPAPRPPTPVPSPPHPVVHGLQTAVVRHRVTTDRYVAQLRLLQQLVAGLLIALTVFGLGVAAIEGVSHPDVVAQSGGWCQIIFDRDVDLDTSCIDDHR